jgi:seryl-tRNA synthetase
MLDLRFIRENTELVKKAITDKKANADIDKIIDLDEQKRKLQFDFDQIKAHQNKVSKEIGLKKRNNENADDLLNEMQEIAGSIKEMSKNISEVEKELNDALLWIPNLPHPTVPIGGEEDNEILRYEGVKPEYNFSPKDHLELANTLGYLDLERGGKISGSGFPIYTGKGAKLERALINFMLDFQVNVNGYEEIGVPLLVNSATMTGTGQLPKMAEDMYRMTEDDLFLIPTAEVPVTNYYANEIMRADMLPRKLCAATACFRREAGSYGKDTKGLQRLHQFNKVEMDEMVGNAESILKALGLHYRVLRLATGDLSFASAMTYDLEVWAPGMGRYLEVSSISNFEDFQARRASIRFRDADGKVKFVHTLNGSGLATPRLFIALLETYQQADGSIVLPDILQKYL